ncbi:type II toxin-antitoxin system Phd/YefM family antitoxin [Sedimentibacter sp.]|uniref:type II toxin-antitoxin system Phd/YefM family antitoxin n=1 Tax=Sedimentibacter sp. TaxID=1960295 RepID=UPI0028A74CA4|nr:type II toxin-antitoxin system Phd/YefM family antitoxin [Sedimentibacter sp.]
MLAVNYSTIRSKLKDYCDKVTDENETVIVTRKDEKNVVILSLEEYNALMKAARNASYKAHELIEVSDVR